MALVHETGDMSVFSIGGGNVLGIFENVTLEITATEVEGAAVTSPGHNPQETKRTAKLTTSLMSTLTGSDRVSHLDCSGSTVNGVDLTGIVKSIKLDGDYVRQKQAGVGAGWEKPQNTTKGYKMTVEMDCTDAVANAFMVAMASATYSVRSMAVSFTLNGVAITIPSRLTGATHSGERDGLQVMRLTLEGKCPDTGAYPTAPTTGTSLLSKAILDWKTALPVVYTSKAAGGFSASGNFIFTSFSVNIEGENIVPVGYVFDSYGTVAVTATT